MAEKANVMILMGSDSDLAVMEETKKTLAEFEVACKMHIASAHRSPEKVADLVGKAQKNGIKVIIAGAGMAAHLAGAVAAHTTLPVIGVPLAGSALNGLDALLSTVQMPSGMPVATMAIGKPGAKNAAILAVQILATSDDDLADKLMKFREKMKAKVEDSECL
ncbi:MAG: 5-(carboxyamino)imidazole ribonucleotide mutase [Pseudomonadota bacterium]